MNKPHKPSRRDVRLAELVLEPRVFVRNAPLEVHVLNSVYGLVNLLRSLPPLAKVAEIGSFRGVSTEVFLLFAQEVTAIDPWLGINEIFDAFLKRLRAYPNLQVVREPSVLAAQRFANESFDLVYLDGKHDLASVRADLNAWLPKVRSGGWIAGHDYSPLIDNGDVIEAVHEVVGLPDAVFEDSSWLIQVQKVPPHV